MAAPCAHDVLAQPKHSGLGPADSAAIAEAARLINVAENPVVLLGVCTENHIRVHQVTESAKLAQW